MIEAKSCGATGSKQTDVIGDIQRIASQKRDDTALLVVTDGITWNDRGIDLRKKIGSLVEPLTAGFDTPIEVTSNAANDFTIREVNTVQDI